MNTEEVKNLLERYWACETSIEEEQKLRDYFSNESIPDDLLKYQSVFSLQNKLAKQTIDPDISRIIDHQFDREPEKGKRHSAYFYPFLKIAASILIVVSVGTGVYTHYQQERLLNEVFLETYSDPEDAIEEARAALDKVSSSLSKSQEVMDQLEIEEDSIKSNIESK